MTDRAPEYINVVPEFELFQFEMPDADWLRVRRNVPELSEPCRARIDRLITMFRAFESSEREEPDGKTKDAIEAAHGLARALSERLAALRTDKKAIDAMLRAGRRARLAEGERPWSQRPRLTARRSEFMPASPAQSEDRLVEIFNAVAQLVPWLGLAASTVPRRPTHSRGNLDWLVERLAEVADEHGVRVTRSEKDKRFERFVRDIVYLAGPEIGDGSVDEALKASIKKRAKGKQKLR